MNMYIEVKPKTKDKLVKDISDFWATGCAEVQELHLSPSKCSSQSC